jgi:nicotinate-nucleotide adenylyltransferase
MKIGILGGTFDPIHNGHLALARAAQRQYGLDKVLFVPAFIPPHKHQRSDISLAGSRYRLVELALRGERGFEICDLEFRRRGISYTVDTLAEIRKLNPDAELFLVLGADAFCGMAAWREPERIREQAVCLVADRPGSDRGIFDSDRVRKIDMPEVRISASQLREDLRKGRPIAPVFLPEAVEKFLRETNLYRGASS